MNTKSTKGTPEIKDKKIQPLNLSNLKSVGNNFDPNKNINKTIITDKCTEANDQTSSIICVSTKTLERIKNNLD